MIVFSCPHCTHEIKVRSEAAGKSGKCKECGETVHVPHAPESKLARRSKPPARRGEPPAVSPAPVTPQLVDHSRAHQLNVAVQVNAPERSNWSNSLGIVSLILGILALIICWIPLIGILGTPLSGLGLLLGIGGGIVAVTRKFAGIGFPIAGTAVCALALMITISVTFATSAAIVATGEGLEAIDQALHESLEEMEKSTETNQVVVGDDAGHAPDQTVANGSNQASTNGTEQAGATESEPEVEVDEWADASNAVQQGDVRVKVQSVTVDFVATEGFGDDGESQEKLLQIALSIENIGDSKKIEYKGWSGSQFSAAHAASLEDDLGNRYQRIGFGITSKIKGQVSSESIYPEQSITDLLVFEVPIEKSNFLKLELPAKAFDGKGFLRLKITTDWLRSALDDVEESEPVLEESQPMPEEASNTDDSEEVKPSTAQKAPEERAAGKLTLAKKLLDNGNVLGERWLRDIIEEFPDTTAAKEAQELLDNE